jgi:uncharacterized sodium:solute symporter family permease YidK
MSARSLVTNAARLAVILMAIAAILVSPAIVQGPNGISYEPVGIAIDLFALAALVATAWSALGGRARHAG